jgi:hypothetical protein
MCHLVLVILDPEVAKIFSDSESVNSALKTLIKAAGASKVLKRK